MERYWVFSLAVVAQTYAQTKLANLMFAKELDRRCKAAGWPITAVAIHPGVVRTELARYLIAGDDTPSRAFVHPNGIV